MPRARRSVALAGWLRVPEVREYRAFHRRPAQAIPVQRMPPPDLGHGGRNLQFHQGAAGHVVPRHVSHHANQTGHLVERTRPPPTTAWKIKMKLAEVMRPANDDEPFDGRVEMDDAYLGGSGGKTGRGGPGKCPIVVAVQTIDGGKPARLKIRRIVRFKRRRVKLLAKRIIAVGATVVTDGLSCFRGLADACCDHIALPTGSGRRDAQHPSFQWVKRCSATSRARSLALTGRSARSTSCERWRNSNGASIIAKISPL